MKQNKNGFTLMEMLIVIAIIAVLIAVAIPVFASQLEKAREATDLANVRSAYAQVSTEALLRQTEPVSYRIRKITESFSLGAEKPIHLYLNTRLTQP